MPPPAQTAGRTNDRHLAMPAKVVKKRNRLPLSCEACRPRKLKCDRQRPCQNCVARGTSLSCSYVSQGASRVVSDPHDVGTEDVRNRVNRLEALVLGLIPKSTIGLDTEDATTAISGLDLRNQSNIEAQQESLQEIEASPGAMEGNMHRQHYVGESHWDAVLRDITALKVYLDGEHRVHKASTQPIEPEMPVLLSGVLKPTTKLEILASMPTKATADELVVRFFEAYNPLIPSVHMLHKPTFLKRYEHYWSCPPETPLIWIGLLYAILCLAMQSYAREGDEPVELRGIVVERADIFRKRAAQCILASDISAPVPNSLEAVILYAATEYSRLPEGNIGLWMLGSLIVRKAMHMGYHRDPENFPSITPFEGELRRRLWMSLSQVDLLMSFMLGLPSMIRSSESDVALPRYLYEEELFEEMKALPNSRSPSEPTQVAYMITKHKMLSVFGKVMQYVNSLEENSYGRVLELNRELCAVRAEIPLHLQMKNEADTFASRATFLQRIQLQLFYHKAICVLNRRFLSSTQYAGHKSICIDSAMSLLAIQARMHRSGIKWWYFSMTNHDFLLASVIACLVLHLEKEQETVSVKVPGLLNALEKSRAIWDEISEVSANARKASRILSFILGKQQAPVEPIIPEPYVLSEINISNASDTSFAHYSNIPAQNDEMGLLESTFNWDHLDSIMQSTEVEDFDKLWNF